MYFVITHLGSSIAYPRRDCKTSRQFLTFPGHKLPAAFRADAPVANQYESVHTQLLFSHFIDKGIYIPGADANLFSSHLFHLNRRIPSSLFIRFADVAKAQFPIFHNK